MYARVSADVLLGRLARDVTQPVVVVMAAEEGRCHRLALDERLETGGSERLESASRGPDGRSGTGLPGSSGGRSGGCSWRWRAVISALAG